MQQNFYSHAPCGARLWPFRGGVRTGGISTHTPLAGRDSTAQAMEIFGKISTHTPLAGRDIQHPQARVQTSFLLTRPLRGATNSTSAGTRADIISTHTPLAGRDGDNFSCKVSWISFLLTRPLRGATFISSSEIFAIGFLLTRPLRGATCCKKLWPVGCYFYSHAPCGARLTSGNIVTIRPKFLLTRPLRGATL